jgi:hypothetical protein
MNLCRGCGDDFSSVTLFDVTFTASAHEHLFDSKHLDGRRCVAASELAATGWTKNEHVQWSDPARIEQARMAFAEAL